MRIVCGNITLKSVSNWYCLSSQSWLYWVYWVYFPVQTISVGSVQSAADSHNVWLRICTSAPLWTARTQKTTTGKSWTAHRYFLSSERAKQKITFRTLLVGILKIFFLLHFESSQSEVMFLSFSSQNLDWMIEYYSLVEKENMSWNGSCGSQRFHLRPVCYYYDLIKQIILRSYGLTSHRPYMQ